MKKTLAVLLALVLTLGIASFAAAEEVIEINVADQILEEIGMAAYTAERQRAFDEAYPNIKVNHTTAPDIDNTRLVQSVATLFMSQDAPACTQVTAMFYAKDLYNLGMAADISAYVEDLPYWSDVYGSVIDGFKVGDALIAYPTQMEMPLMGINREALVNLGLDPDTYTCDTWEDYRKLLEDIKELGTYDAGATFWCNEWWLWPNNWVMANGAKLFTQNDDGTMTLNFTDERMVEAMEFWRGLYKDGLLNNDTLNTADMMEIIQGIWDNRYATFTMYPTWASWWSGSGFYADQVRMMAFPAGPSGDYASEIYPVAYIINARCTEEEIKATVTYLDFMYGYEAMDGYLKYAQENGVFMVQIPKYESMDWAAYNDAIPADWVDATMKALAKGKISEASSTNWSTYLYQVLPEIIMGDDDITELLEEAQETAEKEWLDDFNEDALSSK